MCNTKILSLLLVVSNNLKNFLSSDSDSIYIKIKNMNAGNDERYNINTNYNYNDNDIINDDNINDINIYNDNTNITMLNQIRRHIVNKNILEELENNNLNIHQKLAIIEKYTDIYKNQNKVGELNLLAGDLMGNFYDIMGDNT
jgi:hypothetical protein